jgi:hypothetical protein
VVWLVCVNPVSRKSYADPVKKYKPREKQTHIYFYALFKKFWT